MGIDPAPSKDVVTHLEDIVWPLRIDAVTRSLTQAEISGRKDNSEDPVMASTPKCWQSVTRHCGWSAIEVGA